MDSATRLFRSIAFDRFGSQILETAEVYKKGFFRKKKVFNDYQSSQAVARLIDEMQYVTSMWLQSFDTGVEEYACLLYTSPSPRD